MFFFHFNSSGYDSGSFRRSFFAAEMRFSAFVCEWECNYGTSWIAKSLRDVWSCSDMFILRIAVLRRLAVSTPACSLSYVFFLSFHEIVGDFAMFVDAMLCASEWCAVWTRLHSADAMARRFDLECRVDFAIRMTLD